MSEPLVDRGQAGESPMLQLAARWLPLPDDADDQVWVHPWIPPWEIRRAAIAVAHGLGPDEYLLATTSPTRDGYLAWVLTNSRLILDTPVAPLAWELSGLRCELSGNSLRLPLNTGKPKFSVIGAARLAAFLRAAADCAPPVLCPPDLWHRIGVHGRPRSEAGWISPLAPEILEPLLAAFGTRLDSPVFATAVVAHPEGSAFQCRVHGHFPCAEVDPGAPGAFAWLHAQERDLLGIATDPIAKRPTGLSKRDEAWIAAFPTVAVVPEADTRWLRAAAAVNLGSALGVGLAPCSTGCFTATFLKILSDGSDVVGMLGYVVYATIPVAVIIAVLAIVALVSPVQGRRANAVATVLSLLCVPLGAFHTPFAAYLVYQLNQIADAEALV